jgi:hypothetical protein
VTDQRSMLDGAYWRRDLVDRHFPAADGMVVVMDNLNPHQVASLDEAFPPAEAHRMMEKLEIHSTPTHGSWLNRAEIERGVLHRQALKRRIPDQATLKAEVTAWEEQRNSAASTVHWRFTTADARIKLKRLYPTI